MEHASVKVVVWNRKNKLLNEQTLITDSQMTVQVITMDSQTEVQNIITDNRLAGMEVISQKVKALVLRR